MQLLVLDCENDFYPLLGRTWLDAFYPNWRHFFTSSLQVNKVNEGSGEITVDELKHKFENVF